jgi:glycosyltransferase involved in cell wall biosynthesis
MERFGMPGSRLSIAIVSGAIAPYSNRLFNAIAEAHDLDLHVFTCAENEPQRQWRVDPAINYTLKTLPGLRYHMNQLSHVYFNPTVLAHLRQLRPDGIILGSFSPTMMIAAGYAFATNTPLGISTDGSMETDPGKSSVPHRWVRKVLLPRADVGIGASSASIRLLAHYGLPTNRGHVVPLVSAWEPPSVITNFDDRPFDVLFCGSVDEAGKGALFFGDVLIECKRRGRTLIARIAGEGADRQELEGRLRQNGIPTQFDGYLQPAQLAGVFSSAKLFLFPSRGDAWGLVANEAVLCGTPVLGTPHAVSSVELLERFGVGQMLALDVDTWSTTVLDILGNPSTWSNFSDNRVSAIRSFSLEHAVACYGRVFDEIRRPKTSQT